MKMSSKILKFAVLPLLVVVIILCATFYFFGEHALKVGVEVAATKALGVGVDIDDVDISILKGTVAVTGLTVRNPAGYAHENLLELDNVSAAANIASLRTDTVQIESLKLDGVNLVIEQKGLSNNLHDVISSFPAKDKQQSQPAGKKLRIDNLEITNITVKVKLLPIPGKADTVTLSLPPIRMTKLGADDKLNTGGLSREILLAVAIAAAKEGTGVLPKDIVDTMDSALGKITDLGKIASKKGRKLIDSGKDAGAEIIDNVKNLLLKPKKGK